jgi:4-amino-4-deoxy-L-arabinose transferase-like glycosyltransferase
MFSDEGLYLLVGKNLARGAGLTGDHGPFFWHAPLYMLVEAAYIRAAGLLSLDPIRLLFAVRWLNVVFSGATAALLVLFGRRLRGLGAGALMATLFVLDPYVQRINRRGMLETLAMLTVLAGLYFFISQPTMSRRRWLLSGIAFGLAALTKEAMLLELLTLVAYAAWDRSQLWSVIRTIAVTFATYLVYPAWAFATGQGGTYLAFRLYDVRRVTNLLIGASAPTSPVGRPPTSEKTLSVTNLSALLDQYAMTYMLLALAVVALAVLLLKHRAWPEARYVALWATVSFAVMGVLARISDQYFYYLVVPAIVVTSCVAVDILHSARRRQSVEPSDSNLRHRVTTFPAMAWLLLLLIGPAMSAYNAYVWIEKFGTGSDTAYSAILDSLPQKVPEGSTIVVSDDVPNFFLPTNASYNIRFDRDPAVVIARHEEYFIMSSKDSWAGYDAMSPEFYTWVLSHSQPLLVVRDDSFWTLGLYRLSLASVNAP